MCIRDSIYPTCPGILKGLRDYETFTAPLTGTALWKADVYKRQGEKLATRLGIEFYDKELIRLASEESGLCCEFFEKADEKASQGIIGCLLYTSRLVLR